MKLENLILPGRAPTSRWDIELHRQKIISVTESTTPRGKPSSLLLPALCHPHFHLDKAYLLTCHSGHHPSAAATTSTSTSRSRSIGLGPHPDYTDLTPQTGSFAEALEFTAQAKRRYTAQDLYLRGSQLLAASLRQGVTSGRAFVEVDHVTSTLCLDAGIALKQAFAHQFTLQLCVFAQDPLFSTENGDQNRRALLDAVEAAQGEIGAIGSTPYVEQDQAASMANVRFAIQTALAYGLHLDLHLDYHLDESQGSMVWDVIRLLQELRWTEHATKDRTIVLGHCSRLTRCSDAEMRVLAAEIARAQLPIHFVGLPTSDLFMMGRPDLAPGTGEIHSGDRPRGTIQMLDMIQRFGLQGCLSVNNLGNAFTPWGTGDPLALASLAVGVYQAGTNEAAETLFDCVSAGARRAIGLHSGPARSNATADAEPATEAGAQGGWSSEIEPTGPWLLVRNEEWAACPGKLGLQVPARQRVSVRDVVWDPPDLGLRRVVW